MIIVLDSTLLVSAFLKPNIGSLSYDLLRLIHIQNHQIALSHEILEETKKVLLYPRLLNKYGYNEQEVLDYLLSLSQISSLIVDLPNIKIVRDKNDDVILATAIKAKANALVTFDKDLLTLHPYKLIKILTPVDFISYLRER
jgi:uncharacterized protein